MNLRQRVKKLECAHVDNHVTLGELVWGSMQQRPFTEEVQRRMADIERRYAGSDLQRSMAPFVARSAAQAEIE